MSYEMAYISTRYPNIIVVTAIGITTVVCLLVSIFAIQTKVSTQLVFCTEISKKVLVKWWNQINSSVLCKCFHCKKMECYRHKYIILNKDLYLGTRDFTALYPVAPSVGYMPKFKQLSIVIIGLSTWRYSALISIKALYLKALDYFSFLL